ncbi:uncharacterized protein B0I36DRAFT_352332 [Microdochium trichocladiopsis]|uniref:C3H1-type domain-containing protein n=1 Tax=Microdochium trichocladiopsis TaxID=1682393 RepID=A0A9P8Y3F7_9PEZI|nr:uncharacterized protein B0I36DRAFT_352332 [Microdochium trichocladiopsis]KAH7026482.1 hypothetical protein B0I36DRAFT_352332 [Microdochium trichocladiopsis]
MSNYPYGPPPPPPPPSAAPSTTYPAYGQSQGYQGHHQQRGGHGGSGHGRGRGGGYHHNQGRRDYGQAYHDTSSYAQTANPSPAYGAQPPNGYWSGAPQGGPAIPHHASPPLPASNYHPNYAPQPYNAVPQPYQPPYPSQPAASPYGQGYPSNPHEYSSQQPWSGGAQPYPSQSARGGRDGHHGGRGVPKPEFNSMGPPIRMGFDKPTDPPRPGNSYAPPFPPSTFQQSSLPNLPAPVHQSYGGRPQSQHGHNNRGRGGHKHNNNNRDNNKNRPSNNSNDKARPNGQRQQGDRAQHQKADHTNTKKKKRKTNTLGLTPGDGNQSDEGPEDDEAYMQDYLGQEVPNIPDMTAWIAARKANYPTKARVAEKKASEDAKKAEQAAAAKTAAPKVDPMVEKAEKLRRQLERVERKLEKRKREANDEGDDMRIDDDEDSDTDDEAPESMSIRKTPNAPAGGNPASRADPTTHCKYYATGGNCGKKDKCRFVHDPAVRASALEERNMNKGRMTLKQRLILNDKDHEDMQVVKAIVQLRADGRM